MMDEPETSRARVPKGDHVHEKVLDFCNVDQRLEKEGLDHTLWEIEADGTPAGKSHVMRPRRRGFHFDQTIRQ